MHLQTEQQGNMDIQSKATNVYIIVQGNKWLNLILGKEIGAANAAKSLLTLMREELFAML